MSSKFFGVFYTLICFFGSMLLAFGAEFLIDDVNWIFFGLIVLSLFILVFGIVLCSKRKNLFPIYWEILATEIVLILLIVPTGLWEKFIMNRIVHDWEPSFLTGLQWIIYPIVPALALFLLAIIAGIMDLIRYLSESKNKG